MCGITGFLTSKNFGPEERQRSILAGMTDTMHHRGPDSHGLWMDPEAGIGLGHRRLSIIDLSPAGHQPMESSDGRYVITYNGEVYNFKELAEDLEKCGRRFRGHSDTEVLLEACSEWGLEQTVGRLIGMFAFGLWDRQERTLFLVRDRLGIKPLYWGAFPGLFIFGSELKSLRAHPEWVPELNRDAVAAFLRHNYIAAPRTIYQNVQKLPPGTMLAIKAEGQPQITPYWDLFQIAMKGAERPLAVGHHEAIDQLEALLSDAVGRRMIADVGLGAFLSGGIDSSLVTALMQAQSSLPVRTFSIGFQEQVYNEAVHAKKIAAHLGTQHTEFYVSAQDARDVIPSLPSYYCEPFADSSQIPTFLVSQLTRREVTVALSGDGGDELFAGYDRYHHTLELMRRANSPSAPLRKAARFLLASIPSWFKHGVASLVRDMIGTTNLGQRMTLATEVGNSDWNRVYMGSLSHWTDPSSLVLNGEEPRDGVLWQPGLTSQLPDMLSWMQYLDLMTYLPDDILAKVDRASMAVSLEVRVPILDHRVVEFAWALPASMKTRNNKHKWLLRQVLYRHVPPELIDRPKMGFGIPIDGWLRGELREWAENLLDEGRLRRQKLLDPAPIRQAWNGHLTEKGAYHYMLWDVLMLQAWLDENPGLC